MKVIVAGGRDFRDYDLLKSVLDQYKEIFPDIEIVSGKAKGADSLGEKWAIENKIHVYSFPANWDKFGKSAGYMRNEQMAKFADQSICFWDQKSKGTKHMINLCKKNGLHCKIVYY